MLIRKSYPNSTENQEEEPIKTRFTGIVTTEKLQNIIRIIKEEGENCKTLTGNVQENISLLKPYVVELGQSFVNSTTMKSELNLTRFNESKLSIQTSVQDILTNHLSSRSIN